MSIKLSVLFILDFKSIEPEDNGSIVIKQR